MDIYRCDFCSYQGTIEGDGQGYKVRKGRRSERVWKIVRGNMQQPVLEFRTLPSDSVQLGNYEGLSMQARHCEKRKDQGLHTVLQMSQRSLEITRLTSNCTNK